MKKILFSFIILFACAALSMADAQPSRVPASPFPIKVSQPNGDTIMIRVMGDEWKHFHTTTDGYVIVKNSKGYFCYGKIGAKGKVVLLCYTVCSDSKMTKRKLNYLKKMAKNEKLKIMVVKSE